MFLFVVLYVNISYGVLSSPFLIVRKIFKGINFGFLMENENLYETTKFFFTQKRIVHITKHNSSFCNGLIKELRSEFLILVDEKLGEIPVFFSEIYKIEPRLPKKSENGIPKS